MTLIMSSNITMFSSRDYIFNNCISPFSIVFTCISVDCIEILFILIDFLMLIKEFFNLGKVDRILVHMHQIEKRIRVHRP